MKRSPLGILIADTHLFEKRSEEDTLLENNFEINKTIYVAAILKAKELGLKCVYHLGDVFHSRKSQSVELQSWFHFILDLFRDNDIQLVAIPGNHDKTSYKEIVSFLTPFRNHPALKLVETTGSFKVSEEVTIHMIPFFEDPEYVQMVQNAETMNKFSQKNVLLTHIGVSGAKTNGGKAISSDYVTPSLFNSYDKVLIGHYHDYSEVDGGWITYIGSTHQHNFGENTRKGLTILYDDLSLSQEPIPTPEYLVFHIDIEKSTVEDIKDIEERSKISKDKIRVILHGSEEKIRSFNREVLINAGIDVKTEFSSPLKEEIDQRVDKFDTESIHKEFESFCTKNIYDYEFGLNYLTKVF